jgi:hypothetical protein
MQLIASTKEMEKIGGNNGENNIITGKHKKRV